MVKGGGKKRPMTAWMRHVKETMRLPGNKGKQLKEILKMAKLTYKRSPVEKKMKKKTRKCKYGKTRKGKCRKKYGGNKGDESRSRRDYRRSRKKRRRRRRRR
jgi:hypothetical protein